MVLVVKNPPANAGDVRVLGSILGSGRSPGGRAWQPTLVFLCGESHEQRSLAGYSSWSCGVRHDLSDLAHTHVQDLVLSIFEMLKLKKKKRNLVINKYRLIY